MDPRGDERLRAQIGEMVEHTALDEFANEGEKPGTLVPPVAAAVTSQRTVKAGRESLEPTIISSEVVALTVEGAWRAGVSSARAASASESTPAAGVAARPAAAAVVMGVSSALRRGVVFAHARMTRLFRQPAWCDALPPAEIRALRGLVAFLAVVSYAGVVIGIWDRGVASDRRRALASVEVGRAHPSTPPAVPVTIFPKPVPSASIAAPSVTPPRPAPAPAPAPTPLTTPVTAVPAPPVALPARAQARRVVRPSTPGPSSARRPPVATAAPSRTPSVAVGGSRSESERDIPSAAVAVVPAPPADAVAGEAHLVTEPPGAVTEVDPLAADRSAVKDVLAAYRKSYNDLDAASASAIWEGVDERALRRAFSSLSHQNLSFERCDVRVPAGDRAVARCDGVLSYVPKFGDSIRQQRRMTWNMDFRRNGDHWMIVGVTAR